MHSSVCAGSPCGAGISARRRNWLWMRYREFIIIRSPIFCWGARWRDCRNTSGAAEAFRAAISFNPNFPQAHARLAELLAKQLGDPESAEEHRRLARRMRRPKSFRRVVPSLDERAECNVAVSLAPEKAEMPAVGDCVIVVTGLPRSGTSMLMQMLAAGGLAVLSDGLRAADEDNPRGYLELERAKTLLKDSRWLFGARGKAIKIVAPLLVGLPEDLPCRVILSERDLDEVLGFAAAHAGTLQSVAGGGAGTPADAERRILAHVGPSESDAGAPPPYRTAGAGTHARDCRSRGCR